MKLYVLFVFFIFSPALYATYESTRFYELIALDGLTELIKEGDCTKVKNYLDKPPILSSEDLGYALHTAIEKENIEIVKLLLDAGADITIQDCVYPETLLIEAVKNGNKEIVLLLIKQEAFKNLDAHEYGVALNHAVENHDISMLKLLLENGISLDNIDYGGYAPLHVAASTGDKEITMFLLEKGVDSTLKNSLFGDTPLHSATRSNQIEIITLLLNHGIPIDIRNQSGDTSLHIAAGSGDIKLVQFLIERGADVNAKDPFDFTPLHWACCTSIDLVKFLIQKGVNIHIISKMKIGPVHLAAASGKLDILQLLLDKGLSIDNNPTFDGSTILHMASGSSNIEMVKFVLKFKLDINMQDKKGRTPLHVAILCMRPEIAEFLTNQGADINIKDSKGKTAQDYLKQFTNENNINFYDESSEERGLADDELDKEILKDLIENPEIKSALQKFSQEHGINICESKYQAFLI